MNARKRLSILGLLFIIFVCAAIIITMTSGSPILNKIVGSILLLGTGISLCILLNDWVERVDLVIMLEIVLTTAVFIFMISAIIFDVAALWSISIALICLTIATFFTMLFYI